MSNSRVLCSLILVACMSVAACAQEWVEVKSPHFSVVTDAGEKRGREVALRFEQMRAVFAQMFKTAHVSLPIPLEIIAFRRATEMRPYLPHFQGKPVELTGLFARGEDRSFILIDLSSEQAWEVVFHEYTHQLLDGNLPPTAPWYDEGFAEYLSSTRIDKNKIHVGDPPHAVMSVLRSNRLMPVTKILEVSRSSETYNKSGGGRDLFYAESWLLIHYIYDQGKTKEVAKYLNLANKHVPVEQALQDAFGMDAKRLDADLEAYARAGRFVGWDGTLAEQVDLAGFGASPITLFDARLMLADLKLHLSDHREEAVKEFEDILKTQPDNAAAHRGLGYAYFSQGDLDQAGEHFQQALQRPTSDARVYYLSALVMAQRATLTGKALGDRLPAMRTYLQKAIELDPSLADAYSVLGYANMAEGDYASAVTNCKKAADLSPRKEIYALNLGRAYLLAGKPVEAKAIFESLQDSSDQNISFPAKQALARAERAAGEAGAAERHKRPETYDAPQWRRSEAEIEREPEKPADTAPDTRPVKYLRGLLVSVDCSQPPAASLRVQAAGKTRTMLVRDTQKLLLIGSDEFSCGWKNRKVVVNYKPGGKADGDLVSLEVQ